MRKETKVTEKRRKLIPTKKYKVKVVAWPEPIPKTSNTIVQLPLTTPSAPTNSEKQNPPQENTSDSNPPPFKNIPTHAGTPWPEVGKMSGNLFELRKDWLIPPAITSNPPLKIESQPQEQAIPSATTAPKAEKCGWGLDCPICKNIEEDWDGDHQKQFQQKVLSTQPQNTHIHTNHKGQSYNNQIHSSLRWQVFSAPSHKTSSTPDHKHSMYQTDIQTK